MSTTILDKGLGRLPGGVTDQYLRVWRVILFQQEGMAIEAGLDLPPTPPAWNDPTGKTSPPLDTTGYKLISDQGVFTSEQPTGQAPTVEDNAAGLRIHFTVTMATSQSPNTAEITIYNLKQETVSSLIREYNYVILQAGYLYGQAGTIFSGTVKMYKTGHESVTDSYLKLYCADGEQGINLGTVNTSWPPGTTTQQKIQYAQEQMRQSGGDVFPGTIHQDAINTPPNARTEVQFGMAADQLRDYAQANSAIWYVLGQKFNWISPSSYQVGDVVKLTAATGLIGYPEMTQDGINLTALINPALHLQHLIQIENQYINQYWTPGGESGATYELQGTQQVYLPVSADGLYVPMQINYEGDSRGQPWYMYMVCFSVDPTSDIIKAILGGLGWSPF